MSSQLTQFSADGTAVLKLRRGSPGEPERYDAFEVPWTPGMSLLDALIWIREHQDPTVAVRYSCTNANACKECVAKSEGKTVYLCTARLPREGATVEPLATRSWVRDSVIDLK